MTIKKGDKIKVAIRETFPWWKFTKSCSVIREAIVNDISECELSSGSKFFLFTIKTDDGIPHVLTSRELRQMMMDADPSVFRKEADEAKI